MTPTRWFVLVGCVLLSGCIGDDAEELQPASSELETCAGVPDKEALKAEFTATLFPDAANAAFLCNLGFEGTSCTGQGTHLTGVTPFAGAPPTEQSCRTTTNPTVLRKCDDYAKNQITLALDEGNLIRLLRGVTRLSDVMKRPQVPAYYRWTSSTNKFVTWLASSSVAQADVTGKCTTGSDDDGYYCLATDAAAPDRDTVRGLLELLHRHNGVLVRNGSLAGAAAREASIFRSATGAVNTFTARTTAVGARMGPRVQHVEYLSTLFGLRLLDGSVGAVGTETEALFAMTSYVPTGASPDFYDAGLGVLQTQIAARDWAEGAAAPQTLDLQLARDLRNLFVMLRMTARTASGLAMCDVAAELAVDYGLMGGTNLAAAIFGRPFIMGVAGLPNLNHYVGSSLLASSWLAQVYEPPGGWVSDPGEQVLGTCGMHEQLVAYSFNETLEVSLRYDPDVDPFACFVGEQIVDPSGHTCEVLDCVHDYCTSPTTCYWDVSVECPDQDAMYDAWIDYGADLSPPQVIDEVLATVMTKPRVHAAYNALLDSDDDGSLVAEADEWYDNTGSGAGSGPDGVPDLHHTLGSDAQVSILNAGIGFAGCVAELTADSSDYSSGPIGALVCDPLSGANADCGLNVAPTLGATFFPYAVAVRICPEYTARVTGVYDESFLDHGSCATPWTFTQAVEYYLEHDSLSHDVMIYTDVVDGRKDLLAEFAAETLHLNQPVAAFYRHRADFAAIVGNAPDGTPDIQSYYDQHAGLSTVEARLLDGERIMGQGLDLVAAFDGLHVDVESGTEIIARVAADGYAACAAGTCVDNDPEHAQAMFYRRLRDSIETYGRLSTKLLEVQRRRLDGLMCFDWDLDGADDTCSSCIKDLPDGVPDTDTDADGGLDADLLGDGVFECDPADELDNDPGTGDCVDQCAYFETAISVVEDGAARMDTLATMLAAHRPLADPDVRPFIKNAGAFAAGTSTQLALEWQSALDGVDYLGYRAGRWYPGIGIDPADGILDTTDQLNLALENLEANASDGDQFDSYIHDYLTRITELADWQEEVGEQNQAAGDSVAAYCGGGPDACDTPWSESEISYDVARINAMLERYVCDRTISLWVADWPIPVDFVVGIPASQCPDHFSSPDLERILAFGDSGSIPEQAALMRATLAGIETEIMNLDAFYEKVTADNLLAKLTGDALYTLAAQQDLTQQERDLFACFGAILSSNLYNLMAPAISACGPLADEGGMVPADELMDHLDAQQVAIDYVLGLQVNSALYELGSTMLELLAVAADYDVEVTRMRSLEAILDRIAAYNDTVLDDLVESPLFDPSLQLFADAFFEGMQGKFTEFARAARDIHHLVQYDLGQSVREDSAFESGTTYYLPRLSELTIFKSYGSGFDTAFTELASVDGTRAGLPSEAGLNLFAYASLLAQIHTSFNGEYSDRQSDNTPLYIGNATSGMPAVDTNGDGIVDDSDRGDDDALLDNPGEWAMLADSPFYNPNDYIDIDTDLDPTNDLEICPTGGIDLRDYCRTWSWVNPDGDTIDTGVRVAENSCMRVSDLPVADRYNLAALDRMAKGIDAVPVFECYRHYTACVDYDLEENECEPGGEVSYDHNYIKVAKEPGAYFTYDELGGTNGAVFTADASDQDYYNAQTRVVRNIIDRFRHEYTVHPDALSSYELNVQPGNFLFLLNMSNGAASVQGYSNASYDPELFNLFYNTSEPTAAETISEQIASMALVCTDSESCPNSGTIGAQVVWMGPAYLGDRCVLNDAPHVQERVRFEMDPRVLYIDAEQVGAADPATLDQQVMSILRDPVYIDTFAAEPVHAGSLIISLMAHATTNGDAIGPLPWGLYQSDSPLPRLRPVIDFTYRKKAGNDDFVYHRSDSVLRCEATENVVHVR